MRDAQKKQIVTIVPAVLGLTAGILKPLLKQQENDDSQSTMTKTLKLGAAIALLRKVVDCLPKLSDSTQKNASLLTLVGLGVGVAAVKISEWMHTETTASLQQVESERDEFRGGYTVAMEQLRTETALREAAEARSEVAQDKNDHLAEQIAEQQATQALPRRAANSAFIGNVRPLRPKATEEKPMTPDLAIPSSMRRQVAHS